jgi:hypothetical protein
MVDPEEVRSTVADTLAGKPITFEVNGVGFQVRQPEPEELDEARFVYDTARLRTMARPEIADLGDTPCSAEERASYELMLARTRQELKECQEAARKEHLQRQIHDLQDRMDGRTLAVELAEKRALLVRDRWLTVRLLCDGEGVQVFEPAAKDFAGRWAALAEPIKDAARPAVWEAVGRARDIPFSWERIRGAR